MSVHQLACDICGIEDTASSSLLVPSMSNKAQKRKLPKLPANTPDKFFFRGMFGSIMECSWEPQQRTLAEEISHYDLCLSDDWPPSFARAYRAKAAEAALTIENHQQREWLIEHSVLREYFDDRHLYEQDADVWIMLERAKLALNEGQEVEARRFLHKARELRGAMNDPMPQTKAERKARSKGGNAVADKQQGVMAYCVELILGSDITKEDLRSKAALAERLSPSVVKYMRDHRDELQSSQLKSHADNDNDDFDVVDLIKRWLSKKLNTVLTRAYEERRKQEGLLPR